MTKTDKALRMITAMRWIFGIALVLLVVYVLH